MFYALWMNLGIDPPWPYGNEAASTYLRVQ